MFSPFWGKRVMGRKESALEEPTTSIEGDEDEGVLNISSKRKLSMDLELYVFIV